MGMKVSDFLEAYVVNWQDESMTSGKRRKAVELLECLRTAHTSLLHRRASTATLADLLEEPDQPLYSAYPIRNIVGCWRSIGLSVFDVILARLKSMGITRSPHGYHVLSSRLKSVLFKSPHAKEGITRERIVAFYQDNENNPGVTFPGLRSQDLNNELAHWVSPEPNEMLAQYLVRKIETGEAKIADWRKQLAELRSGQAVAVA